MEFDIWIDQNGQYVSTEAMYKHPLGFKHEVRVRASSGQAAINDYIAYCTQELLESGSSSHSQHNMENKL
ncbi:hypothetical protein [Shewanella marisflavi]|uniref:hypothetical protein n=1 Tax=Shewanella marisflavi TaxID=260364 RepID=UPI003AACE0A3